jgi:hypothetical protein
MDFLVSYQLGGLVIGLAAGALAVLRRWDAVPGFLGALAVFVLAVLVPDLVEGHGAPAMMGAVMMGPVVGFVPVGAGFVAGRWALRRLRK